MLTQGAHNSIYWLVRTFDAQFLGLIFTVIGFSPTPRVLQCILLEKLPGLARSAQTTFDEKIDLNT